jgi:hypothetical protein
LRHLLVDPGLLNRVQLAVFGKALERGDLAFHAGARRDAGSHRDAVDDHRARAALAEPAAEPRTLKADVVAEHVQQGNRWSKVQRVRPAVDLQGDAHVTALLGAIKVTQHRGIHRPIHFSVLDWTSVFAIEA